MNCEIHTMDCMELLDKVPNNTIDLAVIDPPYNLKIDDWDTFDSTTEFFEFTFSWINKLAQKLKSTASLYIFNTPFNSACILHHLCFIGMKFQNWITWDKRDGMSTTKKRYVSGQETILFFTKTDDYTFHCDDIRLPHTEPRFTKLRPQGIIKNGKRWYPNPDGKLCGEVWHFSSERHNTKVNGKTQKQDHASIKPVDMIERIVMASSNPGDLVLDCFMGSGTTAVACQNLGRNFIGCDKNQDYVDMARRRLKTETKIKIPIKTKTLGDF